MSDFKYHSDLCECGRPKDKRCKRCGVCASARPGKNSGAYDLCPQCHGPKLRRSKICRGCALAVSSRRHDIGPGWTRDEPDFTHVSTVEWAAIAGLIAGEGCIAVRRSQLQYHVLVDVGLHPHDQATLENLQRLFGGSLQDRLNPPLKNWRLQGLRTIRAFLYGIRPYLELLHTTKLDDCQVVLDYIEWRLTQPMHLDQTQKTQADHYVAMSKSVKVRQGVVVSTTL